MKTLKNIACWVGTLWITAITVLSFTEQRLETMLLIIACWICWYVMVPRLWFLAVLGAFITFVGLYPPLRSLGVIIPALVLYWAQFGWVLYMCLPRNRPNRFYDFFREAK